MNLDLSLESSKKYHISGELLSTEMNLIHRALKSVFDEKFVRLKSQNDIYVDTNNLSLNIYTYSSSKLGGKNFLVGGNCYESYDYAIKVLHEIVKQLEEKEVVYSLELFDESDKPQQPNVAISHRQFQEILEKQ